jgi:hypothetical protein
MELLYLQRDAGVQPAAYGSKVTAKDASATGRQYSCIYSTTLASSLQGKAHHSRRGGARRRYKEAKVHSAIQV